MEQQSGVLVPNCVCYNDMVSSMRNMAEAHYSYRDAPPAHYTLKIDSFSKFLDAVQVGQKCFTSQIFEAGGGGYKWKLSLYPKGDEERDGKDHISMYLIIADMKDLPLGWEVNVAYKFFILDQIRYKFLSIKDAFRKTSRFNAMKKEWGIGKLMACSDFKDNRNGFLIQDTCILGAEVFVIPRTSISECIMPVKDFRDYTYKWNISPFSSYDASLTKEASDIFTAGNFKWKLLFYPRGCGLGTNKSLSVYLEVVDLDAQAKVFAEFKLCIRDQCSVQALAKHRESKTSYWFTSSMASWGFPTLLSLDDLKKPSSGFLVNDTMTIEVHITNIFTANKVSLF